MIVVLDLSRRQKDCIGLRYTQNAENCCKPSFQERPHLRPGSDYLFLSATTWPPMAVANVSEKSPAVDSWNFS